MKNRHAVLMALDDLGIPYALHEHPPVHTIEDCRALTGIDWSTTEIPRNVFLCNRQKTAFYLMLLRHEILFRTAVVSKALDVSRLSFAPQELLPAMLGLEAGAVSPLGLLFDDARRVTLVGDEGLRSRTHLAFHPCDNTATVVLRADDFMSRFLASLQRTIVWVNPTDDSLPT